MSADGLTALLLDDYEPSLDIEGVSGERLARRLGNLSKIGGTDNGAARRLGFSTEVQKAKSRVMDWMDNAGLSVRQDGAGNVFGRMEGQKDDLPALMSGSHLDTVHWGGHFDGTLGVLSSLEVIEAWRHEGYRPERPFEVVVFSDEEGVRFTEGMLGSKALTGHLSRSALESVQTKNGRSLDAALGDTGFSIQSMLDSKRDLGEIYAFLELHIEQGPRLNQEDIPVGIVTGIAGLHRLKIILEGEAGHAGTTPMDQRKDALAAASRIVEFCDELPPKMSDSAVATVGQFHVHPNSINVIPGRVEMGVDVRDRDEENRDEMVNKIIDKGHAVSEIFDVDYQWDTIFQGPAVDLNQSIQDEAAEAAESLEQEYMFLNSGAGHDAMNLAQHVPAGMLFVRSQGGSSHEPSEWSTLNDCVRGARLLKKLSERLTER